MFFDIQINGCWGVDFNSDSLSMEQWGIASERLAADGTRSFLPTIITDDLDRMVLKIGRLAEFIEIDLDQRASDGGLGSMAPTSQAVGIHIEGPFISCEKGYIGAHPAQHARPAVLDVAKRLVDAGRGYVRLVTLAPEQDVTGEVTSFLSQQNICVAAGHTNASREQLIRSIESGLTLFTHLGNGCPATLPRHDNILNRVIALRDSLHVSLIADGHHLPLWLLRSWVDWFGIDRVSIISDAISAAGLPSGIHTLGNRTVNVGADGVPRSEDGSHFVGSGATLGQMDRLLSRESLFSADERTQLMFTNPSRMIFRR